MSININLKCKHFIEAWPGGEDSCCRIVPRRHHSQNLRLRSAGAPILHGPGTVIIVQGHRLSTTRLPAEWQKAIEADRLLLISPFTDKQKCVTIQLAEQRKPFCGRACRQGSDC